MYTAGNTQGTYRVIATDASGMADTSSVTIVAAPPTLTAIQVTPPAATLQTGQAQQFAASGLMSDGSSTTVTVTWSATGGSITSGGLYTAGGSTGAFRVIATQQGGTFADTAVVSITTPPPTLTAVVLTPPSASLLFNQSQQFNAVGQLSDGSTTSLQVTWTATGGTVSSSGRYTAGNAAGNFRVIATAPGGLADTSTITVTAPTVTAIVVTPPSATLASGASQQFTASATLSDGTTQPNPSVTWTATGGTITTAGRYTAGSTTGAFRVIAASANGKADTSAVTISSPTITAVVLTPPSVSLAIAAIQQFNVSATLSDGSSQPNPSVTWSATGGSITAAGLFTAGATSGTFRVIATLNPGTLADTSVVSITPPGGQSYASTFSVSEKPLSESGMWHHTDATLTVCQSTGGRAFGTQTGTHGTDDSNCYLTGFGANYEVEAVLWINPGISGNGSHEVEILLRWTDDGPVRTTPFGDTHVVGYEINMPSDGHFVSLARFKDASSLQDVGSVGIPKSGDRFRARIEGQRIRVWYNDVLKIDYTDNTSSGGIAGGNPGMGFFVSSDAPNTDFGFDAVTVTALP
jgi:hypothetical protein